MIEIIKIKNINIYVSKNGLSPFVEWLEGFKDKSTRYRIKERLDRVALGNLGDHKPVGQGVMELRFDFGSGYRIYYGEEGNSIILLLCGGNKSSQTADIKKAKKLWKDYLNR